MITPEHSFLFWIFLLKLLKECPDKSCLIIDTNITSNATKHGLPNKRTIARVIHNNPNAFIYFNYDLKDIIFSAQDWKGYSNFKSKMQNGF